MTGSRAAAGTAAPLSPDVFVDPLLFEWEQRRLLDAGWVCLARSEEVAAGGDQVAEQVGGTALLLLRGLDGRLRGFLNTCRHQGTELLPCGSAVNCDVVVCRGHSWTYGLDGALLSAPAQEDGGVDVDYDANALQPVTTAEWLGFVFADADSLARATTFDDHLGGLAARLEPYDLASRPVTAWREYEVAANWKLLLASTPPPEVASAAAADPRRCGSGAWLRDGGGDALVAAVFPNLVLALDGGRCLSYLLLPKAVDETVVLCDWTYPPDAVIGEDELLVSVEAVDAANRARWASLEELLHAPLAALLGARYGAGD